jgi:molybdate transport system substrate-binding protein
MALVVLSSLATKGVLEEFRPQFERELGPLELQFAATQAILPRLAAGERVDLLVLTAEAAAALRAGGKAQEVFPLGGSGVGVAVRAGAPRPNLGSVDAFVQALNAAESVAHSKVGASGIYFSQLLERLPVRLKRRVVVESGPVALVVARGEAELGIQQLCELAPVPGIDIAGPLPAPLQCMTQFAAAIPGNAADPRTARVLVDLLRRSIDPRRHYIA